MWSTPVDNNNQQAYLGMYTTDITAVMERCQCGACQSERRDGRGNAYALSANNTSVLAEVQGQLQTLLTEAPHAVGNSHAAVTAQELIHTTQTTILNEINGDTALATALAAVPMRRYRRERGRVPGSSDRIGQCSGSCDGNRTRRDAG